MGSDSRTDNVPEEQRQLRNGDGFATLFGGPGHGLRWTAEKPVLNYHHQVRVNAGPDGMFDTEEEYILQRFGCIFVPERFEANEPGSRWEGFAYVWTEDQAIIRDQLTFGLNVVLLMHRLFKGIVYV